MQPVSKEEGTTIDIEKSNWQGLATPQEDGTYISFDRYCLVCDTSYRLTLDAAGWDHLIEYDPSPQFLAAFSFNICPECYDGTIREESNN